MEQNEPWQDIFQEALPRYKTDPFEINPTNH